MVCGTILHMDNNNEKAPRATITLSKEDRQIIKLIRDFYGLRSDISAVSLALREMQRTISKKQSQVSK